MDLKIHLGDKIGKFWIHWCSEHPCEVASMMRSTVRMKMKTQRVKVNQSPRPERVPSFAAKLILSKKMKVSKEEV